MPNPNIDWSQAPKDAEWWQLDEIYGLPIWCKKTLIAINDGQTHLDGVTTAGKTFAPLFDYEGNSEDSITFRLTDSEKHG